MKVICASEDCAYIDDKHRCTANSINLTEDNVHTVYDGFQRFNRCRTYRQSEESKEMRKFIEKHFKLGDKK